MGRFPAESSPGEAGRSGGRGTRYRRGPRPFLFSRFLNDKKLASPRSMTRNPTRPNA